jgi:dienelactone hydrolase
MQARDIDYRDQAVNLRGYLAWDETATARRPGVLVFHEGLGLGEFAMARTRMLAELGYVALAADMFGDRRQARNPEEVGELLGGLRRGLGFCSACSTRSRSTISPRSARRRSTPRHSRDPDFPPAPLTFP